MQATSLQNAIKANSSIAKPGFLLLRLRQMFPRISPLAGLGFSLVAAPALAQVPVAAPVSPPVVAPAPVAPQPKFSRNDLVAAASGGNLERVKAILAANPEFVNGTEQQNPLGVAIGNSQVEVARYLLEHGADPNTGSWNSTPLAQVLTRSFGDKWKPLADLLVEKGADVNALDESGVPLLLRLMQNGNGDGNSKERVAWLLDHGINLYASPRGGASLLDSLLASSNTDILKLILARADAKRRDDLGQTLLFGAVKSGKIELVRAALDRGAEVNAQNAYGDAPLHIAARGDGRGGGVPNIELLKTLLDAGANANLPNTRGDLPLHLALRREIALDRTFNSQSGDYPAPANPNAIPRGLQLVPLIDKTDINLRDGGGFSPLLLAVITRDAESRDLIRDRNPKTDSTTQLFDAVAGGESQKVAQLLTAKPYLAFFRLPDGSTPLHMAALWGTLASAGELVKRGADLNARDARGFTPLHAALKNPTGRFSRRAVNMTTFLLSKGADPNIATPSGDAPLHLAARAGDAELVTALLDKGAKINARGVGGETALLILTNKSTNSALYKTLLDRKADVNARSAGAVGEVYAAGFGGGYQTSSIRYFPGAGTGQGTPLHRAVLARRADLVSLLLERGANIEALDAEGKSSLALAVTASGYGGQTEGSEEIFTLLLAKGANPNAKIERGDLLSFAVERGNADLVRALLSSKKVALKSPTRRAPLLFMAISNGRIEVVRALLDAGADPTETDQNGRTPLQAAYSDEIKKLLNERIAALGTETGTATPTERFNRASPAPGF